MTVFDVKLDKFDAASKINVIKEVRGFTELGLKEAKDLVEKASVLVKKGVSKEEGDSPDSVLSSDSSLKIPWTFDSGTEKMYLLKGKVNIYCDEQDDEPFQIAVGDLVEFPNAMQIVFETRDLVVSYSIPNVVTCGNVPLESSFQKVPRIRQFFWGHYSYFDFLMDQELGD